MGERVEVKRVNWSGRYTLEDSGSIEGEAMREERRGGGLCTTQFACVWNRRGGRGGGMNVVFITVELVLRERVQMGCCLKSLMISTCRRSGMLNRSGEEGEEATEEDAEGFVTVG